MPEDIPQIPNRVFDFSRIVSRVGVSQATGIDRVEQAYLEFGLGLDSSKTAFLAKLTDSYVLVCAQTLKEFLLLSKNPARFPKSGFRDHLRLKLAPEKRRAYSYLRRKSLWSGKLVNVPAKLMQRFPEGFEYLNVGHSNLSDRLLAALKLAAPERIHLRVLVHDMIPLDFPQFTREGMPKKFEQRMQAVCRHADQIICNSEATLDRVSHYFKNWGRMPESQVAHLGVEPLQKTSIRALRSMPESYFIILGTIEPRKNHMMLFNIWKNIASTKPQNMPTLVVAGRRGWNNSEVFDFLDNSPLVGQSIFEINDLDDADLQAVLSHAEMLLFPSFTEGYGLPALEAAKVGTTVACSDLPVFREILASYPIYIPCTNSKAWENEIVSAIKGQGAMQQIAPKIDIAIPSWHDHFAAVFGRGKP